MATDQLVNMIITTFPNRRPSTVAPLGTLARIIALREESSLFANVDGWRDIDSSLLASPDAGIHAALAFMPSPMWAHYLPGWMIACLDHGPAAFDLFSGTVSVLSPMSMRLIRADGEELLDLNAAELSLEQTETVLEFIRHIGSLPETETLCGAGWTDDAVNYWKKRVQLLGNRNPSAIGQR